MWVAVDVVGATEGFLFEVITNVFSPARVGILEHLVADLSGDVAEPMGDNAVVGSSEEVVTPRWAM